MHQINRRELLPRRSIFCADLKYGKFADASIQVKTDACRDEFQVGGGFRDGAGRPSRHDMWNGSPSRPGIVQGFSKVALKRWIRAALLAVSGATLAPMPLRAQVSPLPPAATAQSDAPADTQAMIARDLTQLNDTLLRPAASGPRDEGAAATTRRSGQAAVVALVGAGRDVLARRVAKPPPSRMR